MVHYKSKSKIHFKKCRYNTFMPDMLSSIYFRTEEPMTGKLFRFQPDEMYSWAQSSNASSHSTQFI